MIYLFFATGTEELEALGTADIIRRAGLDLQIVSITGKRIVTGAHGIRVECDALLDEIDFFDADLLVLPGGMPGASNLYAHEGVCEALKAQFAAGKKIAAICASPAVVLAPLGILDGKRATCYPGFEQALTTATYTGDLVTVDGNITTGEGPAAAFPYAYELLTQLVDKQTSDQIAEGMRYKHLMER